MANSIDIVIKAVDRASGEINKVTGAGNKLSATFKSLTGFSLGAGAAMAAVGAGVKFVQQAVDETIAYATEIDNLSRLMHTSTEETSRLVQASDDLFVSQETLKTSLQYAAKQGIDVSIEGLKKLSEQYRSLPADVNPAEFLFKTFGRSAAEMGKLMEVGAEGIDAATAAIADNMIVTEQSMRQAVAYKQSVDNLSDSWQGFKYTVGQAVIPELDLLLRNLSKGVDEIEATAEKTKSLTREIENLEGWLEAGGKASDKTTDKLALLKAQLAWVTSAYEKGEAGVADFYAGISNMIPVVDDATNSITDLDNAGKNYYANFQTFSQVEEDYASSLEETRGNIRDLLAEKIKLLDEGYSPESEKIQDITDKIHDQNAKIRELADEHEIATNRIILGFIEQELALDGLTREESAFLIDMGVKWGIYSEDIIAAYDKAMISVDNFVDAQGNIIPEQNVVINVDTYYNAHGTSGMNLTRGATITPQATGGLGGGWTLTGERGAEIVDLPAGSRVHSNTRTNQIMRQQGERVIEIDYRRMARAFAEELQKVMIR